MPFTRAMDFWPKTPNLQGYARKPDWHLSDRHRKTCGLPAINSPPGGPVLDATAEALIDAIADGDFDKYFLEVECTFANPKTATVYGGFGSDDEMCFNISYVSLQLDPGADKSVRSRR